MATDEMVKKIATAATIVAGMNIDDLLAPRPERGTLQFNAVRAPLEISVSTCRALLRLPIEFIQEAGAGSIRNALEQLIQATGELHSFDVASGGDPNNRRSNIITGIQSGSDQLVSHACTWIGFLGFVNGDYDNHLIAVRRAAEEARKVVEDARAALDPQLQEIHSVLSAAKDATAGAAVAVFTRDFRDRAVAQSKEAATWLRWTAWLAVITLLVAVVSVLVPIPDKATPAQSVQYISSKLLVVAILLTATMWCGRLFKATKHQSAMNDHRATALTTFQAFIKSSADDATKSAVLLETTRSIFVAGSTGYLDGGDSSVDSGSKVLEIVKTASTSNRS